MRPKQQESTAQEDLFRSRLEQILNPKHPLCILANKINWKGFASDMGKLYKEKVGRPALPTRLMVGIHYLKYAYNVSDEKVEEMFLENAYWQYFCGYEYFQHKSPFEHTTMSKWRKRMGEEKLEKMLQETIRLGVENSMIKKNEFKEVIVDSTVQEKNIAFPTDARLYFKSIRTLSKLAQRGGIKLRQSYLRVSKKALFKQSQYARANQLKRSRRETRRLRTDLGRLIRDVERKKDQIKSPLQALRLESLLVIVDRIHKQEKRDKNKIYSVHEPEVECIAKGKAHKKYEFGNKVSITKTAKSNWILSAKSFHQNPYDGKTLKVSLEHAQKSIVGGVRIQRVFTDQGYRGKKYHPEGVDVRICGSKKPKNSYQRKKAKRRSSVEPVIGHLKSDYRLGRNFLTGVLGDDINIVLSACAFNLRKLMKGVALDFGSFASNILVGICRKPGFQALVSRVWPGIGTCLPNVL